MGGTIGPMVSFPLFPINEKTLIVISVTLDNLTPCVSLERTLHHVCQLSLLFKDEQKVRLCLEGGYHFPWQEEEEVGALYDCMHK